nr:DNA mismatch repair protein Mlh3-like [Vanessa tameamea]
MINERDKKLNNGKLFESHKSETNLIKSQNNNNTRNLLRKEKKYTKCNPKKIIKLHASDEPLLKKFEEQTKTIQKRCKKLSFEVQSILDRKYFNNIKIHKPNEKQSIDFHINSQNEMREKKAKHKHIKSKILENSRTKQVKTTYDLLKTNENKEKNPINIFTDPQNNVIEESIDSCKKIVSTFDSHNNRRIIKKCSIRKSHKYLSHRNPILCPSAYADKNQRQKKANKLNLLKSAILTEYQNDQLTLNSEQRNGSNIVGYDSKLDNKQPSLPIFNSQANNKDFKLKSRLRFVPKGMSQIFEEKFKKNTDYNDDEKYYEDAIYNHFAEDVHDKFEIFEPRVKNVKEIVSKDLNKVNDKINKDNADLIFSSESLQQAQILGQVDKKFIAARMQSRYSSGGKSSHFLTLFDQHAVDERVRLERNLSDYFDGNKWKSVAFEKFQLKLSHDDYFYLYNYKDKFTQFGLQWTFVEKHVLIHAVPEAILGKNPRKAEIIFTAIKKLISEQIDLIQSSRGNVSSYPKCIMELIFSEACRYAIKFGDQLSKDDCVNMIGALANCKTPFQCAHGRPVMAIIMEIPNNNLTYTVNLNRLKEFKKSMS